MGIWTGKFGYRFAVSVLVLSGARLAGADDIFYSLPLHAVPFADPVAAQKVTGYSRQQAPEYAYAALEVPGEAYLLDFTGGVDPESPVRNRVSLVLRVFQPGPVTGWVAWPQDALGGMTQYRFEIDPQGGGENSKGDFKTAKRQYLARLLARGAAGAAWFRHQIRLLRGDSPVWTSALRDGLSRPAAGEVDTTFDLFTGGQAISENLQFDRTLPVAEPGEEAVRFGALKGIDVAPIDWTKRVAGVDPKLDPLAAFIPLDQYGIFFRRLDDLNRLVKEINERGAIGSRLALLRAEDLSMFEAYQGQWGISLDDLANLSHLIKSVALTGSDPSFSRGTDLALVIETGDAETLRRMIGSRINSAKRGEIPSLQQVDDVPCQIHRSADRALSSYLAAFPGVVVLSNSPVSIKQIAATVEGQTAAIASLDEYRFFRDRYKLADSEETGLVFISDAAIRRWCGPRWRIGESRRVRFAAILAEIQAGKMDRLAVARPFVPEPLVTEVPWPAAGELSLAPDGVHSTTLGSLGFMTPVAELHMTGATYSEANAYRRWRDSYQQNWRWAFDPIALRLGATDDRLSADLSVLPLIVATRYRGLIDISRGAKIAPGAGDPHDTLLHATLAINPTSPPARELARLLARIEPSLGANGLSWLGSSVSLYIDDDPFWQEVLARPSERHRRKFFEEHLGRLPVALWVEVVDAAKLKTLLARLRSLVSEFLIGSRWETESYHGQEYYKLIHDLGAQWPHHWQLCFVLGDNFLLVTPSEDLLHRALDRQMVRQQGPAGKPSEPLLGDNLVLRADARALPLLANVWFSAAPPSYTAQSQCWQNLPILNQWHRLCPDCDPVELHRRLWHEQLVCPGGGQYVWNEQWQTMESTVYGHPAQPKPGPVDGGELSKLGTVNLGVTFEDEGLRARATVERRKNQ